jgi:C4-dicarboxylate-specific signal transduction histidine kinase
VGWVLIFIKVLRINGDLIQNIEELDTQVIDQTKKLVSASKLSAVGEMSANIAHEINNPITVINLACSNLRAQIKKPNLDQNMATRQLDIIGKTVDRITKIINGLKAAARDSNGEDFAAVKLHDLMEDIDGICSERLKENGVIFLLNLKDPIYEHYVECRRVQISQIFINLINNAYDAIEKTAEHWIKIECNTFNNNIEFRISDSGPGVPKEIQEKIFQPFFTTKPIGKGTGLGLSLSMSIIKDHFGTFSIDNESPNTCFVLKLPIERKAA